MSHLKRTVRIHAPLASVHDLAHDPKHWSDWYVGISEEMDMDVEGGPGEHRHMMVGAPFPLTQRVVEDKLGREGGPLAGESRGADGERRSLSVLQVGDACRRL